MTAEHANHRDVIGDPLYGRLKTLVLETTGLAYYADKDDVLADRIGRRLRHLGLQDCATYLNLVTERQLGQREFDALVADLTVGETFFFRYPQQFDALRDIVLPACIERNKRNRCLRIWSAGCATGAEPYSLAILLKHAMGTQIEGWQVTILGTDINREFLSRAQEGSFSEWTLRGLPEPLRHSCFTKSGEKWILKDEYRQWTSFQYHNLVKHPVPSLINNLAAFDIILCRNVMIYFSQEIISTLVRHFHECLVEGGWLLVGHAEPTFELNRIFTVVSTAGATVYRKTNGQPAPAPVATSAATAAAWSGALDQWKAPDLGPLPQNRSRRPPSTPPAAIAAAAMSARPTVPIATGLADVVALANRGELAEAARRCQTVIEADTLNPASHFYHALILEQMGSRREAMEELQRVIYLDRNYPLAHYHLGLLSHAHGDGRRAARHFTNVVAILSKMNDGDTLPGGDGLTTDELRELAQLQLEILN